MIQWSQYWIYIERDSQELLSTGYIYIYIYIYIYTYTERERVTNSKIYLHTYVHRNVTQISQKVQAIKMFNDMNG